MHALNDKSTTFYVFIRPMYDNGLLMPVTDSLRTLLKLEWIDPCWLGCFKQTLMICFSCYVDSLKLLNVYISPFAILWPRFLLLLSLRCKESLWNRLQVFIRGCGNFRIVDLVKAVKVGRYVVSLAMTKLSHVPKYRPIKRRGNKSTKKPAE